MSRKKLVNFINKYIEIIRHHVSGVLMVLVVVLVVLGVVLVIIEVVASHYCY